MRQGEILSIDLYKVYADGLLDRLAAIGLVCHVGDVCCAVPTAADDMVIVASSLSTLQKLVSESANYRGWFGGAMVLGKLPVPGRPTNLD